MNHSSLTDPRGGVRPWSGLRGDLFTILALWLRVPCWAIRSSYDAHIPSEIDELIQWLVSFLIIFSVALLFPPKLVFILKFQFIRRYVNVSYRNVVSYSRSCSSINFIKYNLLSL